MENIFYLLIFALLFWYFLYLRRVAEYARLYARKYCRQEHLQLLSLARSSSKLKFNKRLGPHWLTHFAFEFSGDGTSKYQGQIILRGYKLDKIETPPYRVH